MAVCAALVNLPLLLRASLSKRIAFTGCWQMQSYMSKSASARLVTCETWASCPKELTPVPGSPVIEAA